MAIVLKNKRHQCQPTDVKPSAMMLASTAELQRKKMIINFRSFRNFR